MIGLSLIAVACANYRPEPIVPAQTATALDARRLADPRLLEFIAAARPANVQPAATWNLDTLTLAALYFHPDLDVAYSKLAVAQAAIKTAEQRPNPSISVTPEFNATTASPSPFIVGTAVNLLLELFGKRTSRTEQARALAAAARADVNTAAWQVRGRVRSSMLDLWAAKENLLLAEQRLQLQDQLVGFLERRLAAGEASGLDVARERVNRDQFGVAVRDAERDAGDARVALATAVGVPVLALEGVDLDMSALTDAKVPPAISVGRLRKAALTSRSDVISSLQQYEASQAALRLQVAKQYPDLTLGPGYQYDQGDNKFSLGLTIDLPIFNQNQGAIAEAAARRREAAATFLALQAKIIGEIDAAVTAYNATTRSLRATESLLSEQHGRQARTLSLLRAGQIDHVTLLGGDLELAATRFSRLQALVGQRRALGQMEDALQQPIFIPGTSVPDAGARARSDADSQ